MGSVLNKAYRKRIQKDDDLIWICQCAETSSEAEIEVSKSQLRATSLEVDFNENGETLVVVTFRAKRFTFKLVPGKEVPLENSWKKIFRNLKNRYYCTYVVGSPHPDAIISIVTNHLRFLFNISHITAVRFQDPSRDIRELCTPLTSCLFYVPKLFINKPKVTADEMNFVRDNFENLQEILIDTDVPEGFESWILDHRKVTIFSKMKLECMDLSWSRCIQLEIWSKSITAKDINRFISIWMDQGYPRQLQSVVFNDFAGDKNDIIDGIDRRCWDPRTRPRYFPLQSSIGLIKFDCKDGLDVIYPRGELYREIGTIWFGAERNSCVFMVHPKDPVKSYQWYWDLPHNFFGRKINNNQDRNKNLKPSIVDSTVALNK
ncbi:Protein CBG20179 [Caenorhabditis briggsae]|uniref:Protein CBG20179 n=2 Tax=Caenorhabditis briggsae TaxID=6238 RepID=A8XX89_CAEBR|nr:Protein CBG20179 [Caenorhabditis briggsae]ULU02650.1 hypothetical protein L3Y34_002320 [Caenorhabditis briggsae]CAP37258.1 Protein CBG20179 [Caenorhabditis briggsae]